MHLVAQQPASISNYKMTCGQIHNLCTEAISRSGVQRVNYDSNFCQTASPFSGVSWLGGSMHDVQVKRSRVQSLAALNMLRCCAPRRGTLLTHALDPGVSGYRVGQ